MTQNHIEEKLLSDRKLTLAGHLCQDYNITMLVALTELNHQMRQFMTDNPLYDKNKPYCLERAYAQLCEAYKKMKP